MILSFVLSLNGNFLQLLGLGHTSHVVAIEDGVNTMLLPRLKPSWDCVQGSFLLRSGEQFSRDPVQSGLIICSEDQGSPCRHGYLLFELQTLVNDLSL